ncbi:MAG: hypothetical protein K2X66_01840 [Cyanobacteria bacterium]|nr:hypothetical protein [Cyanobacteriota bacterium]
MSPNQPFICIHVFPSLDSIEVVLLDPKRGNIEKAGSLPGSFDSITRQIEDPEMLTQVIKDLYSSQRISTTTPAILVVPSFFTREIDIPKEFGKEEVQVTLVSEAERFYIFKKNEPQVDWISLYENRVLYTAYPKSEIEKYCEAFQINKIPLMGIELNYFSILRGLFASGAIADEIEQQAKWCLLIVADYTFFAAICVGEKIEKTIEAPLSVGMNDELSAIIEIQQDFENFIEDEPLTKLILVNNSDKLDTNLLTGRLHFQEQVLVIEQNPRTLRSRGDSNAIYPCSLEAIGGSLLKKYPELPHVNLLSEEAMEQIMLAETRSKLVKVLWVANGVVLLLCLVLWGVLYLVSVGKENDLKQMEEKIAAQKTGQSTKEVLQKRFIKKSLEQNRLSNNLMVKIGALIPNELWVDSILVDYESLINPYDVEIKGGALTPELVSQFLNDIKKEVAIPNLEVGGIDVSTSPEGQSYYSWTIKTPGNAAPKP